jgi:hypothetical protein
MTPCLKPPLWVGDGLLATAGAPVARSLGLECRSLEDVIRDNLSRPFVLALDLLNYRLLAEVERSAAEGALAWTFVAPWKRFFLFSPVFGRARICTGCMERRLTSLPPGGSEPDVDFHLARNLVRHRRNLRPAFTPAAARIAARSAIERLSTAGPEEARDCLLFDQLAASHGRATLSALHGCRRCRGDTRSPDRFSAGLRALFEEAL